jgi:hypothetical protein
LGSFTTFLSRAKLAVIEHSIPADNPNTTSIVVEFVHPKPEPDAS